jgi:hypothetical protein
MAEGIDTAGDLLSIVTGQQVAGVSFLEAKGVPSIFWLVVQHSDKRLQQRATQWFPFMCIVMTIFCDAVVG